MEKKEKKGSPKADALRRMREERYEEAVRRAAAENARLAAERKAAPDGMTASERAAAKATRPKTDGTEEQFDESTKRWPKAALAIVEPEPGVPTDTEVSEMADGEWRDLAAEARALKKAKKGKR